MTKYEDSLVRTENELRARELGAHKMKSKANGNFTCRWWNNVLNFRRRRILVDESDCSLALELGLLLVVLGFLILISFTAELFLKFNCPQKFLFGN